MNILKVDEVDNLINTPVSPYTGDNSLITQVTQETRKLKKRLEECQEDQDVPCGGQESVSSANSTEKENETALVSTENGRVQKMMRKPG